MLARLTVVGLILVSMAGLGFAQTKSSSPASQSDIADIRATVLSARQAGFPRARLDLRINESSNRRVIDRGRVITAENYLWTTSGRVDCTDSRNIDSLAACYLLPGDEIRAKLVSGAASGRSGSEWYVYGISRGGGTIPGPTPSAPPRSTSVYGNLLLALEADEESYRTGQPVALTFTLTNTGDSELTYPFSSGQQYDIVIAENGREVWRWSRGRAFIQALTSLTLKPGQSKVIKETWRQTTSEGKSAPPGEYTVTAYLTLRSPTKPTVGPIRITTK